MWDLIKIQYNLVVPCKLSFSCNCFFNFFIYFESIVFGLYNLLETQLILSLEVAAIWNVHWKLGIGIGIGFGENQLHFLM